MFAVTCNTKDLAVTLHDPKRTRLFKQEYKRENEGKFTAPYAGNYELCVANTATDTDVTFMVEIETGVQAKDYSDIVTKEHLEPIELQTRKLFDQISGIRNEFG